MSVHLAGPHVLAVGNLRPAHKRLRSWGARLTLMLSLEHLKPDDLDLYERVLILPTHADVHEWVATARTVHQLDPVAALAGFQEVDQHRSLAIAAACGLRYHSRQAIQLTRCKDQMRAHLREQGVDPTESRVVASECDVQDFASCFGYPLIVKPTDGRASIGVSVVRSGDAIASALEWTRRWAPHSSIMVDQYLSGQEVSVEAYSEDGVHRVLYVTEKHKDADHFVELGHCLPAPLPDHIVCSTSAFVERVLTALDVRDGPTHTEVMLTADGPRLVETHARPGGDWIFELIRLANGVDVMDLWARQTLGQSVIAELPLSPPRDSAAAVWYTSPRAVGTIERVDGEDRARAMPGVTKVKVMQPPGTHVAGVHDSYSRGAYAIATASSPAEALERAQQAARRLRFVVACDE